MCKSADQGARLPDVPTASGKLPDRLTQEVRPLAAPDKPMVGPAAIPVPPVIAGSELGRGWLSYYWRFLKELGRECYGTWRQELTASIVTVLFYYAIDRNDFDLRRGLQATAFTLAAFVCWHLFRVPWLLYKNEHNEYTHWKFGLLGIVFSVFTAWLITYTALWFYTMQPAVTTVMPVPTIENQRIVQLESQLKSLQPFQEPSNSLRRRTMKIANEVSDFLRSRYENHPPYAYPNSNEPNPSEERKAAIKKCQQYDQATGDEYMRKYRDRMVGVVREYNAKGVTTGFLEQSLSQQVPVWVLPGSVWEDNPQYQLGQFRELAYHVDAKDQMITLDF